MMELQKRKMARQLTASIPLVATVERARTAHLAELCVPPKPLG
jgi:hypothetical protein